MTVATTATLLSQSTIVAVGGVVSCVVLFVLLVMCVCGDSNNDKERQNEVADARNSIPGTFQKQTSIDANNVTINVDSSVIPTENGQLPAEPSSRNSYRSSGSSPQPGGHRELPAPPTSSIKTPDEELDMDYDHLTTTNNGIVKRSSKYDHIKLTPEGKVLIEEHKKTEQEHFYSEVKSKKVKDDGASHLPSTSATKYLEEEDADYDTLNDGSDGSAAEVKKISVLKTRAIEDPYASVKDEESGGSFTDIDPYAKVKDDPYSKVKDDLEGESGQSLSSYYKDKEDPYSRLKDDPPYSRVKDDIPYSSGNEEDPYNKVEGDIDSLANSQIEDPYNKVNESSMEGSASGTSGVIDAYASVEPKSSRNNQITRINVTRNSTVSRNGEEFSVMESSSNEYAVVMKSRSDTTPTPTLQTSFDFQSQNNDSYDLPPEPPRMYNEYAEPDDAIRGSGSQMAPIVQISSHRSSSEEMSSQRSSLVQNGGDLVSPEQQVNSAIGAAGSTQQPGKKREPPYHKITARESLASINQRLSRNTYETVAETEADKQAEAASHPVLETENFYATVEGGSGDGVVTNQVIRNRTSQSPGLDHYAEIGATGVRQGNVPAPPSLDSLHIMTKSAEGRLPNGACSPKGSNHVRHLSDQGSVTLDPDYQTVRDCLTERAASTDPDPTDPNYESVQEAESKGAFHIETNQNGTKLIRDHFYEEVKPASEAEKVKKRVLRSHMYEEIDDVKEQKKQLNSDEVWKRRSDTDKN